MASNHHLPYMLHGSNPSTSFINQEGSGFDFGELEEAFVLQGVKLNNDQTKPSLFGTTLEMFPAWPMRSYHTTRRGNSKSGEGDSTEDSGSGINNTTISTSKAEDISNSFVDSPMSQKLPSLPDHHHHQDMLLSPQSQQSPKLAHEKRRGPGSASERVQDPKTLRRLAQNREAARKSRIRKKAYVQQLESSRIKLAQIEQDLQRARTQGVFLGGGGAGGSTSSGAAIFDMEYARWLEDDHRHVTELRAGLQAHLSDTDLRLIVDGYMSHYDEIFQLKAMAAKSDVFHLITGMWTSPAERCFLWMGGFRPSELIKMLVNQLDPLTQQQLMGICSLQHSSQQAEEALTQGLDQLQQSLIETIASGSMTEGMHHMALALGKLANLEGFVRQADNLRQQILHQLCRILTVRQAARCFLVIGEYYGRLRALSSLWSSRPRDTLMSDENSCQTTTMELQMVQSSQNHFSNF